MKWRALAMHGPWLFASAVNSSDPPASFGQAMAKLQSKSCPFSCIRAINLTRLSKGTHASEVKMANTISGESEKAD